MRPPRRRTRRSPRPGLRAAAVVVLLCITCAVASACGGGTGGQAGDGESEGDRDERVAPATIAYAVLPSIVRLTPSIDVERPDATQAIELEAARGEREGAQLVAWAKEGSPRVVLDTGALRGPGGARIPARNVRAYLQHPMVVERGSPAGRAGTYVDPLLPAAARDVEVTDRERLLAWIDVEVPVAARPGTYDGELLVRQADTDGRPLGGEDGIAARIPISLRVRPVLLPARPTLQSQVGLDQSQLVRFEGVEAGSRELRDVTERYAAELAAARISAGDVGVLPPGTLPGHRSAPGDAAYLRRVFDRRGMASVRIPFYLTYPFDDPLGRDRAEAVRYLRAAAAWARREGWLDRAFVFAFDEPDDADAGAVRELHELLRQADPGLRHLVVREAAPPFRGSADIFVPNINPGRFRPADVARERRAGNETWWYPSITTWQPYPTLFIDELRPTPRALGWLAWQRDVRGLLYWSATHWHEVEDPYRDPSTYNETDVSGNGDGVLLYPGGPIGLPGTPVPSVRLLQLRDGIEDHDLLTVASCAGTPVDRARLRRLVRTVSPAIDRIQPSAPQVAQLRAAALDAIERSPRAARCSNDPR